MTMDMKSIVPFISVLLLGGCGTYVTVWHVNAPGNLAVQNISRLERVVVIMDLTPSEKPAGLLGKAIKNLAEHSARNLTESDRAVSFPLPRPEALALLEATASMLASPASQVVGHFIQGPSSTYFFDALGATAVLTLRPSSVTAEQTARKVKFYKNKTTAQTRTIYTVAAEFTMRYHLKSWPDRRNLASRQFTYPVKSTSETMVRLKPWLLKQRPSRQAWLHSLRSDLLPMTTPRSRLLQKKKKPPALKAGSRAARRGDWEQARELWEAESQHDGDFRLLWNLGLYHEREGHWQQARKRYQRALSGARKSGDKRTLGRYLAELDRLYLLPATRPETKIDSWFDKPLAVMPFANHTNDVAAPERIRAKIQKTLMRKGYAVIALKEVTHRMRELGVTDGAHLKAFSPGEITQAAESKRILTGTVLEFKTVNVGVYHLNDVSVRLRLQDDQGRILWESTGDGFRETLVRPKHAGKAFLGSLIKSAFMKATRQYLEEETDAAVLTGLESLPTRPGSRGY